MAERLESSRFDLGSKRSRWLITDVKGSNLPPRVKPPTPTAEFLPPTTARPFSSKIRETSIHLAPAPMITLDPSSEVVTSQKRPRSITVPPLMLAAPETGEWPPLRIANPSNFSLAACFSCFWYSCLRMVIAVQSCWTLWGRTTHAGMTSHSCWAYVDFEFSIAQIGNRCSKIY